MDSQPHHLRLQPTETCGTDTAVFQATHELEQEASWHARIAELLEQIAAQRGIDVEPLPPTVAAMLPRLIDTVKRHTTGLERHDRRWLAAALAALSDHVQTLSLPEQSSTVD